MADALASGASVLRDVGVQVPLRPQRAVLGTAGTKAANSKEFAAFVFERISEAKSHTYLGDRRIPADTQIAPRDIAPAATSSGFECAIGDVNVLSPLRETRWLLFVGHKVPHIGLARPAQKKVKRSHVLNG